MAGSAGGGSGGSGWTTFDIDVLAEDEDEEIVQPNPQGGGIQN